MTYKPLSVLRSEINQSYLADENKVVAGLLTQLGLYEATLAGDCAELPGQGGQG